MARSWFSGDRGVIAERSGALGWVDGCSDLFSLGIVLFEMLAGKIPFTDESPLGLMLEVVRAEIPDVHQINGEVDEKIAWILSKTPRLGVRS